MDSVQVAEATNASESTTKAKLDEIFHMDANSKQVTETSDILYDAEAAFNHENPSLSQEFSSIDKDTMDVDSESTYSCIDTSSDEDTPDSTREHDFTSQSVSSANNSGQNADEDKNESQTCEADPNILSESSQVNNEVADYIVPKIGVEFESEDHAYKCYNRFALMEGFSIRKDFVNRSKVTGLVVSRRYTCHRQGHGSKKHEVNINKPRKETRTGCLAHMTVTRQPNGKYRVIHFETRHNHEFATPVTAHLLPSQKRISFVEAVDSVEGDSARLAGPNWVPKLGMGFDSEDQAYDFYNAYAARLGFSVRKDYVNRSKVDGAVASRRYTCFREGYRQKDRRDVKVKKPRKETRVGCMAQLVISRQSDGKYRATHFEETHNHELVPPCKVRTLRSQKRSLMSNNVESGLHPKTLTELLLTGVGVHEDLGYDPIDHGMKLSCKRAWSLKQEEVEIIHRYFQAKNLKDPSFFYAVQLDANDQMTNFFWADEKMLTDYSDFGDVVCFDTTNKDSRPLVLFFGVNNHKQLISFGAAIVYDNSSESFKWLFRTLMKASNGKCPKTLLSCKDGAISEAVVSEFPETQRWLCTWQIYQNAVKNLSEVIASSDSFSKDLRSCISNLNEDGFVNSWKIMLDTYGLWESQFLHEMFEERDKWALPYNKHIFSADIITALLTEDSISNFRKSVNPESHILQCVKHFSRVVNDWRYKELEANYDMTQHTPRIMGDIIMLKELREVYTPVIFEMFHREFESYLNIVVNQCVESLTSVEYKVSMYGEVEQFTVMYTLEDDSVACSCMKFEFFGILCSHAIKVFDCRNVKIVPSQYVLKRWTRSARS